ncbi:MAG: EamA family transporter [Lachnospirales bacterium]
MNSFKNSIKKNYNGILLIILSAILTSIGQLCWKLSVGEINMYFIVGFALYGLGAIIMIIAFKFGSLSVIHPFMCSSYIFAFIWGYLILGESISMMKIVGAMVLILGVLLIGGGDE